MKLKLLLLIALLFGLITQTLNAKTLIERRLETENETRHKPFVIIPHDVNYILPVTYSNHPDRSSTTAFTSIANQEEKIEAKFQISVKVPLWYNIFSDSDGLYFGFTSLSFWQVYNKELSSPFRETNYEPQLFWLFENIGHPSSHLSHYGLGVSHQSNGQSGALSRSWNRVYGFTLFGKDNYAILAKAWFRIPESNNDDKSLLVDDNPDIEEFLGNFELTGLYAIDEHRFTATLRNNLKKENRNTIELTYSYPISGNLRLYAQYFNGYGESLIDYNHQNQRIGIGISLGDLL